MLQLIGPIKVIVYFSLKKDKFLIFFNILIGLHPRNLKYGEFSK